MLVYIKRKEAISHLATKVNDSGNILFLTRRVSVMPVLFVKRMMKDEAAGIAVVVALLLPIILLVGLSVLDLGAISSIKHRAQDAADSSVLAVVRIGSKGHDLSLELDDGVTEAASLPKEKEIFYRNLSDQKSVNVRDVNIHISRDGDLVKSEIVAKLTYHPIILQLITGGDINIEVKSEAVSSNIYFTDFYVLLDNSPSMGLGATKKDIDRTLKEVPGNCAFTCHISSNPNTGDFSTWDSFHQAKSLGIKTRIEVAGDAVGKILKTAQTLQSTPRQYKFAVFDLGTDAQKLDINAPNPRKVVSLTYDFDSIAKKAGEVDLMRVPSHKYPNRQTYYQSTMSYFAKEIPIAGNGITERQAKKVLLIVTDGINDSLSGSNRLITTMSPSWCKAIKDRGVKIAILYTTYLDIPSDSFWRNNVRSFTAAPSKAASDLKECASPELFYEVKPDASIEDAFNNLFVRTLSEVRVSR